MNWNRNLSSGHETVESTKIAIAVKLEFQFLKKLWRQQYKAILSENGPS